MERQKRLYYAHIPRLNEFLENEMMKKSLLIVSTPGLICPFSNLAMNLYWNKPPDQLTLIYNNGWVIIRGVDFDNEGFSLTNEEGGGGYIPATEDDVQLTEDHG